MNRIEIKSNSTLVTSGNYTPNFANGQYLMAYITILQELECDTGDKSISITLIEWANEFTLYAFKIIDGPKESETYAARSNYTTEFAQLKVSIAAPVNNIIKVIVYYQLPGRIEFDQFKAVIVIWAVGVDFTLWKLIV